MNPLNPLRLVCIAALCATPLAAQDDIPRGSARGEALTAGEMAELIDRRLESRRQAEGVTAAVAADDAEFLRRVYLDIAGRIPTVEEAQCFEADTSDEKRRDVVEELLAGPGYVRHFGRFWRGVLLPEAAADIEVQFLVPRFDAWLRDQLASDVPYDRLVRRILTTPFPREPSAPAPRAAESAFQSAPYVFYQTKQVTPENLAAAASRMFLGVRLECAQCHDHFFDNWKREDFWSLAAFFGGIQRQPGSGLQGAVREVHDRREIAIPDTTKVVQATFLGGSKPSWRYGAGSRETLAEWITSARNPYFSRAAVNRIWGHFFGTGLVNPVDDFSRDNPPSHPELLDDLAREFAANGFDLKFLIRAITASRAYGLSSRQTHPNQANPAHYARMKTKGLTSDQLFDSLALAVGYSETFDGGRFAGLDDDSPRSRFRELFDDGGAAPGDDTTSILQALAMMNGSFVAAGTRLREGRTLSAIADYPFADDAKRIETLYLAALARRPRPDELADALKFVQGAGADDAATSALGDLFWALLNSGEFMSNH
jgi:hypothetical protein